MQGYTHLWWTVRNDEVCLVYLDIKSSDFYSFEFLPNSVEGKYHKMPPDTILTSRLRISKQKFIDNSGQYVPTVLNYIFDIWITQTWGKIEIEVKLELLKAYFLKGRLLQNPRQKIFSLLNNSNNEKIGKISGRIRERATCS